MFTIFWKYFLLHWKKNIIYGNTLTTLTPPKTPYKFSSLCKIFVFSYWAKTYLEILAPFYWIKKYRDQFNFFGIFWAGSQQMKNAIRIWRYNFCGRIPHCLCVGLIILTGINLDRRVLINVVSWNIILSRIVFRYATCRGHFKPCYF